MLGLGASAAGCDKLAKSFFRGSCTTEVLERLAHAHVVLFYALILIAELVLALATALTFVFVYIKIAVCAVVVTLTCPALDLLVALVTFAVQLHPNRRRTQRACCGAARVATYHTGTRESRQRGARK